MLLTTSVTPSQLDYRRIHVMEFRSQAKFDRQVCTYVAAETYSQIKRVMQGNDCKMSEALRLLIYSGLASVEPSLK